MNDPDRLIFGPVELQIAQRRLLRSGEPLSVGARAFDLLVALAQRRERVVTKAELLDLVWPGLVVEENNLSVQIGGLRKLLGPPVIATIPGRGYQFTAAVDDNSAVASVGKAQGLASELPSATLPAATTPLDPALRRPRLIGRDDDLRQLLAQIEIHALVTVVGAGGIGKTALAMAAAAALEGRFRDGLWVVELAAMRDPSMLVTAVMQALRIAVAGTRDARERLLDLLSSQVTLLLLDNCEHLIEATAALAEAIVARAPGVRVLATSQKLLNVRGETLFKLGPLETPSAYETQNLERYSAVELFVERAQGVQPDFAVGPTNIGAVADICRRLDGMPLAIELAAARVRLLGVQGIRERLAARFKLLTGGSRTAMPRHQTLVATIDWSHALLSDAERVVLRRLGVFVGGFSLELAQGVAADHAIDAWAVLDALSTLVDGSLVQVDAGDPPRYRLLESTRDYALNRMAQGGEVETTRRRHAHAVRDLVVQTEKARFGENGTLTMSEFMQRLAPEIDNIRAAFDWATEHDRDIDTAIALASGSAMLMRWLALSHDGMKWILPLRAHIGRVTDLSTQALFWTGVSLMGLEGRLPSAELLDANRLALTAYRETGERRRLIQGLYVIGWSLAGQRCFHELDLVLDEMRQNESAGDPPWLRANRLNLVATKHLLEGQFEDAFAVHTEQQNLLTHSLGETIALITCRGNMCAALNCLGRFEDVISIVETMRAEVGQQQWVRLTYGTFQLLHAQSSLGRVAEADQTMRQTMRGWRRDGMVLFGSSHLAMLLAEQGRWADAARVDGASQAYALRSGMQPNPLRRLARRRTLALFEAAALSATDLGRWRREGEALDDHAIAALCLDQY